VVVDDGSTEPVEDLLGGIDDERLRVLRLPHGGVSVARNAGMAAARGDRVRFIDGDDVFTPDGTALLLDLLGDDENVIAYGAAVFCDESLRPVWTMSSTTQGDARVESLLGLFDVRPWSMLFPRRVLEATGNWDPGLGISQDWDFIQRALEHAHVRGRPEVTTYYRKHPGGATAAAEAGVEAARVVVARYFERHPEERGTALERRAQARVAALSARIYLTHRQPLPSLRCLGYALARDPRAVGQEVAHALPALRGRLRRSLLRAPASLIPEEPQRAGSA
jgi:glycosyltransferase involved in cell wall biosynthesis